MNPPCSETVYLRVKIVEGNGKRCKDQAFPKEDTHQVAWKGFSGAGQFQEALVLGQRFGWGPSQLSIGSDQRCVFIKQKGILFLSKATKLSEEFWDSSVLLDLPAHLIC